MLRQLRTEWPFYPLSKRRGLEGAAFLLFSKRKSSSELAFLSLFEAFSLGSDVWDNLRSSVELQDVGTEEDSCHVWWKTFDGGGGEVDVILFLLSCHQISVLFRGHDGSLS